MYSTFVTCMRIIGFNITFELYRNNQWIVASIKQMFGICFKRFQVYYCVLNKIQSKCLNFNDFMNYLKVSKCKSLKAGVDLHFLPLGKIFMNGSITDTCKNCSALSQPEMLITQIKFKIQCCFRTLFQYYS